MRLFLAIFTIILCYFNQIEASVCITEVQPASYENHVQSTQDFHDHLNWEEMIQPGEMVYQAAYACKDLDDIGTGLEVASIYFAGMSLYTACSGPPGLAASVAFGIAGLSTQTLKVIVTNLDCDNSEEEAELKKKIDNAICDSLQAQGLDCITPIQEKPFTI